MVSVVRRRGLQAWATLVYWTGKVTGVLVADVTTKKTGAVRGYEFTAVAFSVSRWQWAKTRAWNAVCLMAVAYRIGVETWPVTLQATRLPQASCYDTVCGGVWCVYACVYYAVGWLDRASEFVALVAAITWRRSPTVDGLNSAATGCLNDVDNGNGDDEAEGRPSTADVPWHAYLAATFPAVQFVIVAYAVSPSRINVWRTMMTAVVALSSCAPIAAHGTATALLIVANNSMRSINYRVTRLTPVVGLQRRRGQPDNGDLEDDAKSRQRATITRLAHRHWWTTELVSNGVCDAYGVDLMAAVLMAAVRITYVAISVFHRLTDNTDAEENAHTNMSVAVVLQLIAWFGQFVYLAYTCDELMTQSKEMFDNLNSLLLDIFKESRLSGEPYTSKMQEIEAVQDFMHQVVARKVIVHACGGLITLNLSLITTIIGVTLTYFIVLLQFESSHDTDGIQNVTTTQ